MPRLVYLLGFSLILVAGAFVLTDRLLWEPGVTAANVKRIRPGMRLAEVRALLGGVGFPYPTGINPYNEPVRYGWSSNSVHAQVEIGPDGRVTRIDWHPAKDAHPSAFSRLRSWLGR